MVDEGRNVQKIQPTQKNNNVESISRDQPAGSLRLEVVMAQWIQFVLASINVDTRVRISVKVNSDFADGERAGVVEEHHLQL